MYWAGVVEAEDSKHTDSLSDPENDMLANFLPRLECVLALPQLFFDDTVLVCSVRDMELLLLPNGWLRVEKNSPDKTFLFPECELELLLVTLTSTG